MVKKIIFIGLFFLINIYSGFSQEEGMTSIKKEKLELTNVEAYFKNHVSSKIAIPFETDEEYNKRMQWWGDAKYGMFIHWGLYSVIGGEYKGKVTPKIAEWIQNTFKIPLKEYKELMRKFNPQEFSAKEWVEVAKSAGMKYIVITAKHHDGFAMFNSKASDYNIMNTPFKRDVIKELKEECYKQGLKFGVYYSHVIDWEHPHAFVGGGSLKSRMNTVDYDINNMDRGIYLKEKAFPQVKELLTNYGKIDIIWFDMGKGLNDDEVRQFVKLSRELQPNIIISSRVGDEAPPEKLDRQMLFDYYTPSDNYFTGNQLAMPWEMAGTTNTSWGYRKDDDEWRSPEMILNSLVASVSRNGNYLLNVGPKPNGIIPEQAVKNLKEAGHWLKKNGEAIYNTKPSPFKWNYNWGYVTRNGNKIYLTVFNWPDNNKLELNGIFTKIKNIYSLADTSEKIVYYHNGRFLNIDLNTIKKNEIATLLVVECLDDNLQIANTISQNFYGKIQLDRISGNYLEDEAIITWRFKVNTPGRYKITIVSNEKGNHNQPIWEGAKQKGSIQVSGNIIPIDLKRDEEKIDPSLFFFKEITSHVGNVEFLKRGTYTLQFKGFKINAEKWSPGFGLKKIELNILN